MARWLMRCSLLLATLTAASAAIPLVNHGELWLIHKGTNAPQADWSHAADAAPPDFHLRRVMDCDDGYIAYLDGIQIAHSSTAPPGTPGHTATAPASHEASCCNAPMNAPKVLDFGAGPHVLAVQGFNEAPGSRDFHLIADLALAPPGECPPNTICADTTWSPAGGAIALAADTTVAAGAVLTVEAGTTIRLMPGVSLRAAASAGLDIRGTAKAPVRFEVEGPSGVWGELAAEGAGSFLSLRHADVRGGAVKIRHGAVGLIEDSYIHHYKSGINPIAGCDNAKSVVVRRTHFDEYHETLWQYTPVVIEDSLFENASNVSGDALDFDGAPPGSAIRRCTFRHGPQSNTDAIDLGSGTIGTVVEDCLIYDFPNDKGVSIGENSFDIVVRNCLVYGCHSGVAVKDGSTVSVIGCTFVGNDYGIRSYNKADPASATGGGHVTESHGNIFWGNSAAISILNGGTMVADHSNFNGTNWVGLGNISLDPLFLNPSQRDYRLSTHSPSAGAGRGNSDMGARFPVGAPMAPSHPSISSLTAESGSLVFHFWLDSFWEYSLLGGDSIDATAWSTLAHYLPSALPRAIEAKLPKPSGARFFGLARLPKP